MICRMSNSLRDLHWTSSGTPAVYARRRSAFAWTATAWLLATACAVQPLSAQNAVAGSESQDPAIEIFVPPPRELVRPLNRAREAIADGNYRDAVSLLGEILTPLEQEDYLRPLPNQPSVAVSLHREAQKLLGQIPRKHRVDYELKYSVAAQQMLIDAVSRADFDQMARVCRHYFYTDAGYAAAMLLGHHYLESGQPVSASAYFSQLVGHPDARAASDPEASVLLATCWLMSGHPDLAMSVLIDLKQKTPDGIVHFLGKPEPLFEDESAALPWLKNLIGDSEIGSYTPVSQWLMFRGNSQRNAQSGTGFPLTFPRWYQPTINDPDHEHLAQNVFQKRLNNGECIIPSIQPLAVRQTIVFRSLDQLIGVDFVTGKRIWQFPAWQPDALLNENEQAEEFRRSRTMEWHVDQRIWRDHLYGQFSSDGDLVFIVDRPGYADQTAERAVLPRGVVVDHPFGSRGTNELKAVELSRQGAFRWEIGGQTGGREPRLAGCFFLGAPLPLNDELYVLCELGGEIRLVVLEADTGQMKWSQQIAAIDSALPIAKDPLRRLAGATPSYSDGILICPTSASGVVAIELATRSLLWGVRYPNLDAQLSARRNTRFQLSVKSAERGSIDASATIADGRLFVMPVEGNQVLCYDLISGQPLWGDSYPNLGKPRQDDLFVACVAEQSVVLVGQSKLRALHVESGEPVWETELASHGTPSGRGFATQGSYFLPTSENRILQVRLNDGHIERYVETDRVLGNLICFGGNVISLACDVLATYRQAQPTREIVQRARQQGELDPETMVLQAQLHAQDGKWLEATRMADQAFATAPSESRLRLLLDLILKVMKVDYRQSRSYVVKYENELLSNRKAEFLAAQFQGHVAAGQRDEALQLMLAMMDSEPTPADQFAQPGRNATYRTGKDPTVRLRLDHWLKWQFTQLFDDDQPITAEAERVGGDQNEPVSPIAQWLRPTTRELSPATLARLSRWFDADDIPADARIQLARFHIQRKEFLQAERQLNGLVQGAKSELTDQATAMYCRLLLDTGWASQAMRYGRRLAGEFENDPVFKSPSGQWLTGAECFEQWFQDVIGPINWNDWAYGTVTSELKRGAGPRPMNYRLLSYPQCIVRDGLYPEKIQFEIDLQQSQLTIFDASGGELGRVSYKPPETAHRYSPDMISGRYALHGHLLLFAFGYDMIGVDLFKLRLGQDGLLWHQALRRKQSSSENFLRSGYSARTIGNPWGDTRYVLLDRDGNSIGGFASNGTLAFFQIGDSIQCSDTLTGEIVWRRSGMPQNCQLFADRDFVAVLNSRKNHSGRYDAAQILESSSGSLARQIDLKALQDQTLWWGDRMRMLFTTMDRDSQSLTLFDLQQEKVIWNKSFPKNTLGVLRDVATLAVCRRDGQFELIDIPTGQTRWQLELDPHRAKTMQILPLTGHDLVILNRNSSRTSSATSQKFGASVRPIANSERLVNGTLYCIDYEAGRLKWPSPIRVQYFAVPQNQPADLPILTLNRLATREKPRRMSLYEFYSIDLRDGRLVHVFQKEQLPFRSFDMSASHSQQAIDFRFGDRHLTLSLRNETVPPTAPASLTNEFTLTRNVLGAYGGGAGSGGAAHSAQQMADQQQSILDQLQKRKPPK